MNTALQKNIAGYAVAVASVLPQSSTAQTINGSSIDRMNHNLPQSAILHTVLGAAAGSVAPTGVIVQSTLQHSPDNATWTNLLYDGLNTAQGSTLTVANSEQNYPVELSLANRFLRVQTVVTFIGGTAPTIQVFAELVLGGEQILASV